MAHITEERHFDSKPSCCHSLQAEVLQKASLIPSTKKTTVTIKTFPNCITNVKSSIFSINILLLFTHIPKQSICLFDATASLLSDHLQHSDMQRLVCLNI